MCNSDLLSNFTLNDYEKNLIWSFYKETFGGDGNNRSLYRLHTMTKEDNIYQIITQVAASTFPEDYLQYFEKSNGVISTRLLQDYALENIEKDIVNNLQQTCSLFLNKTIFAFLLSVILDLLLFVFIKLWLLLPELFELPVAARLFAYRGLIRHFLSKPIKSSRPAFTSASYTKS